MLLALTVGLTILAQPEYLAPVLGKRCGRIIITGNTDTPDRVILEHLDMRPGQKIMFGQLQTARRSSSRSCRREHRGGRRASVLRASVAPFGG